MKYFCSVHGSKVNHLPLLLNSSLINHDNVSATSSAKIKTVRVINLTWE